MRTIGSILFTTACSAFSSYSFFSDSNSNSLHPFRAHNTSGWRHILHHILLPFLPSSFPPTSMHSLYIPRVRMPLVDGDTAFTTSYSPFLSSSFFSISNANPPSLHPIRSRTLGGRVLRAGKCEGCGSTSGQSSGRKRCWLTCTWKACNGIYRKVTSRWRYILHHGLFPIPLLLILLKLQREPFIPL